MMGIAVYFDIFIGFFKEALENYTDCEGYNDNMTCNEVLQNYDEEVEIMWLASQAQ